jgi:uncharacterized membrane protein YdjX (TVP38/TMEM64 family)
MVALGVAWFAGLGEMLTLERLAGARDEVAAWIRANAILFFIAWIAIYATGTATLFPVASFLTILGGIFGGAAFGVLGGTLYAGTATLLGATLGASILFTAVKTLGLEQLRRRVAPFLDRFSAGIEEDAFFYLLSLRLIPFFPFFAVNIAPAMLKISLTTYALATLLGIAPAVYVYTSLGAGVADLSELTVATWNLWGPLLALAALSLVPIVWKRLFLRGRRATGTDQ